MEEAKPKAAASEPAESEVNSGPQRERSSTTPSRAWFDKYQNMQKYQKRSFAEEPPEQPSPDSPTNTLEKLKHNNTPLLPVFPEEILKRRSELRSTHSFADIEFKKATVPPARYPNRSATMSRLGTARPDPPPQNTERLQLASSEAGKFTPRDGSEQRKLSPRNRSLPTPPPKTPTSTDNDNYPKPPTKFPQYPLPRNSSNPSMQEAIPANTSLPPSSSGSLGAPPKPRRPPRRVELPP